MHRFFVMTEYINDNKVFIHGEQARHLNKVLRLKTGNRIIVFDNSGFEYEAVISEVDRDSVRADIVQRREPGRDPAVSLNLVQGMAKGDKMDIIIQKTVEIGVKKIYPLISEYTVINLKGERAAKKVERWQQIAIEACKQCGRNLVPEIMPPVGLNELLARIDQEIGIMLYEAETGQGLKQVLKDLADRVKTRELYLLVGPEGGFSSEEARLAKQKGVITASLGPRILRTETAAIVGSSMVFYEYGDLG